VSLSKRIAKNTLAPMLARIISPLLSLYLIVTIARHMGAEGLGAYSFVYNFLLVFQIVSALGLTNLIAREIARNTSQAGKYFSNVIAIGVLLGFGFQSLMLVAAGVLGLEGDVRSAVLVVSFSLYASSIIGCLEGILTGLEKIRLIAASQIIENVFRVTVSLLFVFQGYGLVPLVLVILASRVLALAVTSLLTFRQLPDFRVDLDLRFAGELIKKGRTFALIMISVTLYWKLDIVMLQQLRGEADVGIYSAAYRIFMLMKILPQSFVTSVFPVISNFFESSTASFEQTCRREVRYIAIFSLPLAFGVSLLAPQIIQFLYTESFADSIMVLRLLAWTLVPYGISVVFAYSLVASNHQNIDLRVNVLSLICNFVLNLILIPKLAFVGAAIATLASSMIYLAFQYPFVVRHLFRPEVMTSVGKPAAAAVLASSIGTVLFMVSSGYLAISISFFAYCWILVRMKAIAQEDSALLRLFLRRNAN